MSGNLNQDTLAKMEQRIIDFLENESISRESLESYDPFRFRSSPKKMSSFSLGAPKIGSSLQRRRATMQISSDSL
jgi:hypothetical protein